MTKRIRRDPRYCLQCDDGTMLVHDERDSKFTYKGCTTVLPKLRGWHCPQCGEIEFDGGEAERYGQAIEAFAAEVDARESADIRAARKRLGLTQAEAGTLFGGGQVAFSEYERGKTKPHKSTVLLLRLLVRHPELLAELRG